MRLLLFCLLTILGLQPTYAQDPLEEKMNWYDLSKPSSNLFVHFDKNVYSNNETIWFTGYLIKSSKITTGKHKVLSVALISDADSTIVLQDRFLIRDGISFGSMVIPDSLLTGNYHLLAHTDITINGKPEAVFSQAITLKTNIDPKFKANLKILESINNEHKVLVTVTSKDGLFLPKPTSINYRYAGSHKTEKTDATGQLLITLPLKNNLLDPNIYVKLKYDKDSSLISLTIPQKQNKASVSFYPEGGNLVDGLTTTIGWEVKDQQRNPIALNAFLYQNDKVIDTIETGSYGIGKFKLIPAKNAIYTVKLNHTGLADSSYHLPHIIDKGLTMTISDAVVEDTLKVNLKTNSTRHIIIRVHNFRESYVYTAFNMQVNTRTIKIPLQMVPKGLTTLTITDSLGNPLLERMFFAHYNNAERLQLATDKQAYKQREKVTLQLKLPQTIEKGLVSIACIQDNRMEQKKMTDIESYTYLNRELSTLPTNFSGSQIKDKAYLEEILLVKGWRKYTWPDFQKVTSRDTIQLIDSLKISAQVYKNKKVLTQPLTIGTMGGNQISILTSSVKGEVALKNEELYTAAGKKLFLFVNDKNRLIYDISIKDPYYKASKSALTSLQIEDPMPMTTLPNNAELVIKGNEKEIRLNEITVTAKKDNAFNFSKGLPGRNACGDYVCPYNILNCPNHVSDMNTTQPIAGKAYISNGHSVIYNECKTAAAEQKQFIYPLTGIHLAKEFYVNDYAEPQEPAFFSTIYWNYATILGTGKPTELSFYTSDITGRFRIVVQGLSNKDVIYADHFFDVKK